MAQGLVDTARRVADGLFSSCSQSPAAQPVSRAETFLEGLADIFVNTLCFPFTGCINPLRYLLFTQKVSNWALGTNAFQFFCAPVHMVFAFLAPSVPSVLLLFCIRVIGLVMGTFFPGIYAMLLLACVPLILIAILILVPFLLLIAIPLLFYALLLVIVSLMIGVPLSILWAPLACIVLLVAYLIRPYAPELRENAIASFS